MGNCNASLVRGQDPGAAVKALNAAGASISSDQHEGVINGDTKHEKTQFKIDVVTSPCYEMSLVILQDE